MKAPVENRVMQVRLTRREWARLDRYIERTGTSLRELVEDLWGGFDDGGRCNATPFCALAGARYRQHGARHSVLCVRYSGELQESDDATT